MSELTHAIRRIANPERRSAGMPGFVAKTLSTAAVTGLAALVLVPAPGHALSMGEITVRSALGQPLRATVPVRTAAGEVLGGDCIRVASGPSGSGLVPLSQARVLVTGEGRSGNARELVITTPRPLYEPMYELALQVNCPGAPGMVRQYVLMLDLPAVLESATPVAPPAVAPMARQAPALPRPQRATAPATPRTPAAPIADGVRYRVQPGDTLSSIAARVQGRTVGIWTMVEQIHAANPGVFPDGNLDRLPAGVELLIPGSGVAAAPTTEPAPGLATAPPEPVPGPATTPAPVAAALPEAAVAAGTANQAAILAEEPAPAVAEPAVEVALEDPLPAAPAPAPARSEAAQADVPAGEPAPAEVDTGSSGWSPLAAMAAGAGFGILISLLLWSRRLGVRLRPASAADRPVKPGSAKAATAATAVAAAPVMARVAPPPEPAISVSYDDLDEPLARSFGQAARSAAPTPAPAPMDDITADLEQLFLDDDQAPARDSGGELDTDGGDTREQFVTGGFETSEPTGEFPSMTLESPTELAPADLDPRELGIDLDDELTRLGDAGPIDVGFSDHADLELDHPTVQRPMPDRDETIVRSDDGAPGATAGGDRNRKPSLLDAMDLLERDYEEEMTASQLLDPELVQAALEGGPDADQTGIRRRR